MNAYDDYHKDSEPTAAVMSASIFGQRSSDLKAQEESRIASFATTTDQAVSAPEQPDGTTSVRPLVPGAAPYMQNRELSWLDFNERVLDQGSDRTVPLLERLNFVSIFWSNLQEFFMVRVGSLTDLSLVKKPLVDSKTGMTPSEQLDAIYARCHELYPIQEHVFEEVRGLLFAQGVCHLRPDELNSEQREYLAEYVKANVMPFLSPQIINPRHPFPHLENGELYVVVRLDDEADYPLPKTADKAAKKSGKGKSRKEGKPDSQGMDKACSKQSKKPKDQGAEGVVLGLVPMPRQCARIIPLPDKKSKSYTFILLEHAIELFAADIFSMYTVKHTNLICVTRNADLDATEGTDEQDEDYREHMKRILKKRSRLAPVRLECERALSDVTAKLLLKRLKLKKHQVFVTSVPMNMTYTYSIAAKLSAKKLAALTNVPFTPQWPALLDRQRAIIDQIHSGDVLLSYPFESMDPFIQLLREAAGDPHVISIKITLYRLASQSHLAEALIAAAENGKEVTALFELRARFDESNNIEWSQRFEEAGCNVIYGFRNYKVHSKICCITRQTEDGLEHITQLGTGNYNEKTARLYTDYSFITCDKTIGQDAVTFFRNMGLENTSDNYDILWVAPLQIKPMIIEHIDEQIARAVSGKPSGLFFKTNSVTDKDIIEKIVEASCAGVETMLFVRGISCLVPGVPDYTENVRVISIVGRLLEHSRIYGFGAQEDMHLYLSSADLMTRNMDKRIEIAWPVLDESLKRRIIDDLNTYMQDTAKLRELLPNRRYTPLGSFAQTDDDGEPILIDAQDQLIKDAQQRHTIAVEAQARHETLLRGAQSSAEEQIREVSVDETDALVQGEDAVHADTTQTDSVRAGAEEEQTSPPDADSSQGNDVSFVKPTSAETSDDGSTEVITPTEILDPADDPSTATAEKIDGFTAFSAFTHGQEPPPVSTETADAGSFRSSTGEASSENGQDNAKRGVPQTTLGWPRSRTRNKPSLLVRILSRLVRSGRE